MTELTDYGGPFDPDFTHLKFSKETILRLLKVYSEYMLRVDGFWYLTVMQRWGNAGAFECDKRVWGKAQLFELQTISRILNIRGNDVATVMKAVQASPWMWLYDYSIDLKNPNHAIVTYYTCPTLTALEREGTGRERLICREFEPVILGMIAHYFNPNIRVTPIRVPPRTDYHDICCRWEFKLENRP